MCLLKCLARSGFDLRLQHRVSVDFASPMGKILPLARQEENCNAGATPGNLEQVAK
jgi:hypothetical protein